jgi:nucleoside-diphosphate-sugar epimerase
VRRRFPYWLAFCGGFLGEVIGRAIRLRRPPHLTRYAVGLIGRPTRFSIDKARNQLGWQPRVQPLEGLRRTLEWYHAHTDHPDRPLSAAVQ